MNNDKIEEIIKEATNRFLGWKLPDTFRPDGGISYDPNVCETVGTHVFTAQEATEMFRFCLEDTLTTFAEEIRKERVTHCDDINCPECNKVAYEAGVKAEREKIVEWAKTPIPEFPIENENDNVLSALHDGAVQGYQQAVRDVLELLSDNK